MGSAECAVGNQGSADMSLYGPLPPAPCPDFSTVLFRMLLRSGSCLSPLGRALLKWG